ncbi:hypothetical protein [Acidianus sp. HS-5]|uniref:hypothetical protein n=1 Tax=Acidianus sp. HS-5 TaxID=2886040 RepID=UPI001F1D1F08|nr:hypothetical protein [Acidianus sp. HS-5]BDC19414.1 hypothetical protein HS5_23040 [Acidianus sp. HS-5]
MKLFGHNVDSILTPEANYIVTRKAFVPFLAEEFPEIISLNSNLNIIRELIVIKDHRLQGNKIQIGYKYTITSKSDGRLSSLKDCKKIVLGINAKLIRNLNALTSDIIFFGFKKELEKILILHDVPIMAKNKEELYNEISNYLLSWGINATSIPAEIKIVPNNRHSKSKILDMDYALFSSQLSSNLT